MEKKTPPEKRIRLLMKALDWQGGIAKELADITGCNWHELLYSDFPSGLDSDFIDGLCWHTTSKKYQDEYLIPQKKGNLNFWLGVIRRAEISEIKVQDIIGI